MAAYAACRYVFRFSTAVISHNCRDCVKCVKFRHGAVLGSSLCLA